MFHASVTECCEAVFSGKSCKHYNHGCHGGATPASTDKPASDNPAPTPSTSASTDKPVSDNPAPTPSLREGCSEHGWHIQYKNNDGCTNDDNIIRMWLLPSWIDLMFYQTPEACCDQFFKGRECKIYDAGCDDSAPASPSLAAHTGETVGFYWEDEWEDMKHFTFS